ncbi:alanine racemase [Idiomarina fontislapidosi]|uniref:Alanine racemase n=1 Tax=Idiomarina fontislapidosi TaxID=263723 RepID=A0A432XQV0_9GAMM|nr:alanine racemase [Idiomarina fontislapidosi]PYE30724.1 alanine racemase [Idiomarina fontislapidosi]RUO51109.1 alanine racemase [Idiomarina fontislapidosi]
MRPLVAEINLDALLHNYQLACNFAPNSQNVPVIKADAYGHGAVKCAKALEHMAPAFAVSCIDEALNLRHSGIRAPILLLEGFYEVSELPLIDEHQFWTTVHSEWQVSALLSFAPKRTIKVWVKVDSGMHRLGFSPNLAEKVWSAFCNSSHIEQVCLMSHFATADAVCSSYFSYQMEIMKQLKKRLGAPVSLANSAAILNHRVSHGEWNRLGVMLYGSDPLESPNELANNLKPVMTLRSKVIAIRELKPGESIGYGVRWKAKKCVLIAVVAAGYGDGYDRHAKDGTPILINGQRAEVVGRVSMDMITVDVTNVHGVRIGSEAILWGRANNGVTLSIDEIARHCDTISYTLMTGVTERVPKLY